MLLPKSSSKRRSARPAEKKGVSIKNQLISLIISAVILAIFFAALHGYRNSLKQLENVFDQELISIANVVLNVALSTENIPTQIPSSIVFQVIQNGNIISTSEHAPSDSINGATNGFHVTTFFGQRWRTYTTKRDGLTIVVAQPVSARSESAEDILFVTIVPFIVVVPIIGLLIYYIIHTTLGGLTNLSKQLKIRNPQDLSEVDIGTLPTELSPVVDRLNSLLKRLSLAFEREKQLSANAAHELRTPISVLTLTAHNIEREFSNGTLQKDLLEELNLNIKRQAHVIEQIIALYRFNPEQFSQSLKPIELIEVLQEIISNNFEQIDANRQIIELEGDAAPVQGDYFALYTLFENIITNSIKYGGHGAHILITVKALTAHAEVTIEDSGMGIKDKEIQRVFERFYRAKNNTAQIKGSGLGMSIAKHITDLHGGTISCERSPLGGLRTGVFLPCTGN